MQTECKITYCKRNSWSSKRPQKYIFIDNLVYTIQSYTCNVQVPCSYRGYIEAVREIEQQIQLSGDVQFDDIVVACGRYFGDPCYFLHYMGNFIYMFSIVSCIHHGSCYIITLRFIMIELCAWWNRCWSCFRITIEQHKGKSISFLQLFSYLADVSILIIHLYDRSMDSLFVITLDTSMTMYKVSLMDFNLV